MSDLKALSDAATQGIWGQFGLSSGPWQSAAKAERKAKNFAALDSSHHMSAVIDGKPKRLSEWKHADDAAFAEALVNAYRAGTLVDADLPPKVKAWQPIETAPRDGTRIFVSVVYEVDGETYSFEWVDWWYSDDEGEGWLDFPKIIPAPFPPTHWMPLPDAPDMRPTTQKGE